MDPSHFLSASSHESFNNQSIIEQKQREDNKQNPVNNNQTKRKTVYATIKPS
jgi:hypothetical protein